MTRNIIGSLLLPIMIANRFLVVAPSALAEPFNLFSSVQGSADEVVKQLRELPTPLPGMARSDGTIPSDRTAAAGIVPSTQAAWRRCTAGTGARTQ